MWDLSSLARFASIPLPLSAFISISLSLSLSLFVCVPVPPAGIRVISRSCRSALTGPPVPPQSHHEPQVQIRALPVRPAESPRLARRDRGPVGSLSSFHSCVLLLDARYPSPLFGSETLEMRR